VRHPVLDFKVFKEHSNINCRLNSFVCRNINVWNSLPAHVVDSDSVAMFKRRLSRMNICYVVNFRFRALIRVILQPLCSAYVIFCFYSGK